MGELGLIPGLERSPGEGKGYPLQYSDLENSMDCIVHMIAKSWTQLGDLHFHHIMDKSITSFLGHQPTRQEYCTGLPCPPSGDLPDPGIEPMFLMSNLHWQAGSFTTSATWEAHM